MALLADKHKPSIPQKRLGHFGLNLTALLGHLPQSDPALACLVVHRCAHQSVQTGGEGGTTKGEETV